MSTGGAPPFGISRSIRRTVPPATVWPPAATVPSSTFVTNRAALWSISIAVMSHGPLISPPPKRLNHLATAIQNNQAPGLGRVRHTIRSWQAPDNYPPGSKHYKRSRQSDSTGTGGRQVIRIDTDKAGHSGSALTNLDDCRSSALKVTGVVEVAYQNIALHQLADRRRYHGYSIRIQVPIRCTVEVFALISFSGPMNDEFPAADAARHTVPRRPRIDRIPMQFM